jgi:hypothetical protein
VAAVRVEAVRAVAEGQARVAAVRVEAVRAVAGGQAPAEEEGQVRAAAVARV